MDVAVVGTAYAGLLVSVCSGILGKDVLSTLTKWNAFCDLDFQLIHNNMNHPILVQDRNIHAPELLAYFRYRYRCLGWEYRTKNPFVEASS